MSDDLEARATTARRAAEAGAAVASEFFRNRVDVETKSNKTDVVTEADRRAQRRVIETIRDSFPDDAVVGEEEDELKRIPENGNAWVVDPIDGTNNFVRGIRTWATSVAAVRDGEPVAAANVLPALGDTYVFGPAGVTRNGESIAVSEATDPDVFTVVPTIWWPRDRRDEYAALASEILHRFGDMRRFGCAQAVLSMVAEGSLEGAVTNVDTNPWDTVAGVAMVRAAGGRVTDVEGNPWRHDSRGLVASNGTAHDQLVAATKAAQEVRSDQTGRT